MYINIIYRRGDSEKYILRINAYEFDHTECLKQHRGGVPPRPGHIIVKFQIQLNSLMHIAVLFTHIYYITYPSTMARTYFNILY